MVDSYVLQSVADAIRELACASAQASRSRAAMIEVDCIPRGPGEEGTVALVLASSVMSVSRVQMEHVLPPDPSTKIATLPGTKRDATILITLTGSVVCTNTVEEIRAKLAEAQK